MNNPTVFISYARADSEFVLMLGKRLRREGIKIWLDQLDIPPGCGRISSHIEVNNSTCLMQKDDEAVKVTEGGGGNDEKNQDRQFPRHDWRGKSSKFGKKAEAI
jgi:TIR domain